MIKLIHWLNKIMISISVYIEMIYLKVPFFSLRKIVNLTWLDTIITQVLTKINSKIHINMYTFRYVIIVRIDTRVQKGRTPAECSNLGVCETFPFPWTMTLTYNYHVTLQSKQYTFTVISWLEWTKYSSLVSIWEMSWITRLFFVYILHV